MPRIDPARATLCRDVSAMAMLQRNNDPASTGLQRLLVVVLIVVVPIVAFVVVRRVADRDLVVIVVAGTGGASPARDGRRARQRFAQIAHCGGIRSFCPG
jgi:hypothetical protein